MKKQLSILAVAAALLMSITSCSKDNDGDSLKGKTGTLKLTVGFTPPSPGTRAAISTAKPTTDWAKNIKSLQLLLVTPATNKVAYSHNVALGNMVGNGLSKTYNILNTVPAGTFDMYLIANNREANPTVPTLYPNGYASTDAAIVVGTDISAALANIKLKSFTDTNADAAAVSVGQANEIFWAKSALPVTITADTDNTPAQLNLTRAVGMFRVLINKSHVDVREVKFTSADSPLTGFRIRNIGTEMKVSDKTVSSVGANNTIVALGGFKTAADFTALTSDYKAGGSMGVVADAADVNDFTYWSDYLAFPGGATTGANRFNLVIAGWAPAGYTTANGSKLQNPGLVYWTGPVNEVLTENGILEMNVVLQTPGIGGPTVPPVGTFGNLTVNTQLIEWGAISSVVVPL